PGRCRRAAPTKRLRRRYPVSSRGEGREAGSGDPVSASPLDLLLAALATGFHLLERLGACHAARLANAAGARRGNLLGLRCGLRTLRRLDPLKSDRLDDRLELLLR